MSDPLFTITNMCSKLEHGPDLESYPDDPSGVTDEELEAGIKDLERISLAAQAKKLRWVAEAEGRAVFRRDGFVSSTEWLSDRLNVARGTAKEQLKTAQVLEAVPEVQKAMATGEVSSSSIRVLTAAWESHPEAFQASGASLLEAAKTKRVGDLRRTVEDWSHGQDQDDGLEEARKAHERRRFDICPTASGTVSGTVELDPEGGETVMTALQAYVDSVTKNGRMGLRTPPAAPGRRPGGAVPAVPGLVRSPLGGGRAAPPHRDRGSADPAGLGQGTGGPGQRRIDCPGDRAAPGLRCLGEADRFQRILRAPGRGKEDPGRAGGHSPGGDRS